MFVGARNAKAGSKAAEEIEKKCGKATFLEIDVADNDSVTTAAREFSNIADHLDVLVNNAGIIDDGDDGISEVRDEVIRDTLEANTLGALRVTRAFVPLLRKSKAPRVVNVSSSGGQLTGGADGWAPAYCISKAALNGVTVQLAAALPKFAVNSVCPGWVRTEMGGGKTRTAQWRKARTQLCGLSAKRRRLSPVNSCVIVKRFRGDPPSPRLRRAGPPSYACRNGFFRRSWPIVVGGPWPESTVTSSPSGNNFFLIPPISRSMSPPGKSPRPMLPAKRTSPPKSNRSLRKKKQRLPGQWPGTSSTSKSVPEKTSV